MFVRKNYTQGITDDFTLYPKMNENLNIILDR